MSIEECMSWWLGMHTCIWGVGVSIYVRVYIGVWDKGAGIARYGIRVWGLQGCEVYI